MVRQTTNTSGFSLYPECTVILKVTKVVLKSKKDDESVKFYVWSFDTLQADNESIENELQFLFFSSQMGELLAALGGVEITPGKYDWDDEEVIGKCVRAKIVHEIIKGNTKHTIKEIEAYTEEETKPEATEERAWDDEIEPKGKKK